MKPLARPRTAAPATVTTHGVEWLVEAYGCEPARLADPAALAALFDDLVRELDLHPVAPTLWHPFESDDDTPGGVTGLCALAESHLAVHTFPEHGSLCLNVFCCRPRPEHDVTGPLRRHVGAADVTVRRLERRYVEPEPGR